MNSFHLISYDGTSEVPLIILKTRPYVSGMFTWEGFDYIGEPTPYYWPARSSQFGLVDLCGFPKDNYYLYKIFRYVFSWLTAPISYLDFFLERSKFAVVIASSLYFVGKK